MILKICGITNQADADAAVEAGATALGFNFYPRSPRYIAPAAAAAIASPAGIRRVGVFVNKAPADIETTARAASLDVAQLHGSEPPAAYPKGLTVWKAARVSVGFSVAVLDESPAEALLLDGPASGETFAWELARGAKHPIILAGGLDESNVARAIAIALPWGVDACSRIESEPGKKDHQKMTDFLRAAREALAR